MARSEEMPAHRSVRTPLILEFADRNACEDALSKRIAAQLDKRARAGRATAVLSGGTTPAGVYARLSAANIDWSAVTLTLSDERWVDTDDADSNERMIRASMLRDRARQADFVGLKTRGQSPEAGLAACERRLAGCHWPASVVLLGMGSDGHTASLFPDDPGLAAGLNAAGLVRCVAAHPKSSAQARISLSLACLLDSELICLLIMGADKRVVLNAALEDGPAEDMPVRGVLKQQRVPVEVYWAP